MWCLIVSVYYPSSFPWLYFPPWPLYLFDFVSAFDNFHWQQADLSPNFFSVSVFDLMSCHHSKCSAPQTQKATGVHGPEPVPFTTRPVNLLISPQKFIMVDGPSSSVATMYAIWGWIVVLKEHTLWCHLFEPLKQGLGGCQLH
jgi:hypothetical protein